MDIAVLLLLDESRMIFKIIFLRMFEDKICAWVQDITCKDLVRYRSKVIKSIGWISKDYIELLVAYLEKLKHIMAHNG